MVKASSTATILKQLCLLLLLYFFPVLLSAQSTQVYKPSVSRILFIVDGSGSMKQKWGEATKFQMAKDLLFKLIDSVEKKNPNVEFAVRVFGAQFSREQNNCKDSKLYVKFAPLNAQKINIELSKIIPQGMSPIAHSIELGAKDFPDDAHALNSIILITDGEETCGGDPCKMSKDLLEKKISLKPFIVGLNVDTTAYAKFKCMGTFYDTKDQNSFYNTVGVIIRQTLNTTTAQINLLDQNGDPSVSNIPFTLYDHRTGKIEYNFVHTLNEKGNPDTLFLDPVGVYDLELHTFPPIRKDDIELTPGKHNIIAVEVPYADLNVECIGASVGSNDAQILVRSKKETKSILNVQDLNGSSRYLSGEYKLQMLTTPTIELDTIIQPFAENKLKIDNTGQLSLIITDNFLASVYSTNKGSLQMQERFETTKNKTENHRLQPGQYKIVYKPKDNYHSESTKTQQFIIEEGKTVVLTL